MNFKTTIGLVVLATAVGLFFFFSGIGGSGGFAPVIQATPRGGHPLPLSAKFQPDTVTRITVTRDGKTVVLSKKNGHWTETEPVVFPVRDDAAQSIIDDATSQRYIEQFTPTPPTSATPGLGHNNMPTLKDVGLSPASATVTLTGKNATLTLEVGSRSMGGHGYVRIKGDSHVYVVSDELQQQVVDQSDHDWRQKSLTGPKASQASEVRLVRPGVTVQLDKHNGRWFLGKRDAQRASADSVGALLDSLRTMSIDKFVADNPKNLGLYGLAHPRLVMTVRKPLAATSKKKSQTAATKPTKPAKYHQSAKTETATYQLRVGAPVTLKKDKYFATFSRNGKLSPVVFTIDASAMKDLDKSANDLRDPQVVTTKSDEVQQLVIDRARQPRVNLVKASGYFEFGKPRPPYDLDYQAAHDLIDLLTSAKATGYVPNFKPAGKPVATVTIHRRGVGETETLHIYKPKAGKGYLCVRDREPVAYRVAAKDLKALFEPLLTLRDKTVFDLPAKKLVQVTLKRDDGAIFTFLRATPRTKPASTEPTKSSTKTKAPWKLRGHKQFESDSFHALLGELAPLRASRWLNKPISPGKGWITLTVDFAHGSPKVLHVDPATRHADLTGIHDGFVLGKAIVKKLNGEYRLRSVLPVQLGDLTQVVVLDGAVPTGQASAAALDKALARFNPQAADLSGLVIKRDSDGNYTAAGSAKLSQSAAADIFDTLAGLTARRFIADHTLGKVYRRLRVTTKSSGTVEVVCFQGADHRAWLHGKLNGKAVSKWFTLSASDMHKLEKSPRKTKPDEESGNS